MARLPRTVSSPKQSYFLNATTDFDGVDRQPHAVYKTDYTLTIPIAGQAMHVTRSMLQSSQPCVRDVDVLGDCPAAGANATDNLAIDHDRDTATQESKARLL